MHSEHGGQRQSFGTAREHSGGMPARLAAAPSMEHPFSPEPFSFGIDALSLFKLPCPPVCLQFESKVTLKGPHARQRHE